MDRERARANFLAGLERIEAGLALQRGRIVGWSAAAPEVIPGVTDLRGAPSQDLDYYIYELARLQDLARKVADVLDEPTIVVDSLAEFDRRIPGLRRIRNPLTHIDGWDRLVGVLWFDSVVEAGPDGSVSYLVDPRYGHHDAALLLVEQLRGFLTSETAATR